MPCFGIQVACWHQLRPHGSLSISAFLPSLVPLGMCIQISLLESAAHLGLLSRNLVAQSVKNLPAMQEA